MNKNKFLIAGLTTVLAISNVMPVLAADTQSFNENGSADILVNCEIESGYTVILPAAVTLEKTDAFAGYNYGKEFKIGVQGNIDSDKAVTVQAKNDSFEMKAGDRTVNFDVKQDVKEWPANELGDGSEKIEKDAGAFANIKLAGNYKGDAEFEFFLGKGETASSGTTPTERVGGLYDENGTLVKTWDELVEMGLNNGKSPSATSEELNNILVGKLVVPNTVTTIQDDFLRKCKKITEVEISNSVTHIGAHAFDGAENITSIILPNNITIINNYTFTGCYNLASINIPDSVTTIKMSAFMNCHKLTLNIPNSVTTIGATSFANVPHVYYNGPATGAPWGAKAIN